VIDGVPDESGWSAAAWTTLFVDIEGDRQPKPTFETRAKMVWDDEYFYVAARMEEPHLWATLKKRDSVIYYDNDFEVFLDPDGDSHLYTEIELNALNTVCARDPRLGHPGPENGRAPRRHNQRPVRYRPRVDGRDRHSLRGDLRDHRSRVSS
jgi:hypothetical protein